MVHQPSDSAHAPFIFRVINIGLFPYRLLKKARRLGLGIGCWLANNF